MYVVLQEKKVEEGNRWARSKGVTITSNKKGVYKKSSCERFCDLIRNCGYTLDELKAMKPKQLFQLLCDKGGEYGIEVHAEWTETHNISPIVSIFKRMIGYEGGIKFSEIKKDGDKAQYYFKNLITEEEKLECIETMLFAKVWSKALQRLLLESLTAETVMALIDRLDVENEFITSSSTYTKKALTPEELENKELLKKNNFYLEIIRQVIHNSFPVSVGCLEPLIFKCDKVIDLYISRLNRGYTWQYDTKSIIDMLRSTDINISVKGATILPVTARLIENNLVKRDYMAFQPLSQGYYRDLRTLRTFLKNNTIPQLADMDEEEAYNYVKKEILTHGYSRWGRTKGPGRPELKRLRLFQLI